MWLVKNSYLEASGFAGLAGITPLFLRPHRFLDDCIWKSNSKENTGITSH